MKPHYRAIFNVDPLFGVPNMRVTCDDVRLESNIGFSMVRDTCRALISNGSVDGPIAFFRDGAIFPSYEFDSILLASQGCGADFPIVAAERGSAPVALSQTAHRALSDLAIRPDIWNDLHGKLKFSLRSRALVDEGDAGVVVTASGRAAIEAFQRRSEAPDTVKRRGRPSG